MTDKPDTSPRPETEAHYRFGPVEVTAHGMTVQLPDDADGPEIEAHGRTLGTGDPAVEAYARLVLAFPPDMPEGTYELSFRPSTTPGGQPEVEVHSRRFYDPGSTA